MGYFTKQMYNEPESMYVDPRLDILANSLGAVQKKHDENYANMSAFDIMANNIEVAQGDKAIKDAALARLKQQRDAIASSGDYAYATPKIGMAVRDFSNDANMTAAKENMIAIKEAEKQRQALGASALDFNPATNWSTIDPTTGQARRFTSGIEKQLDWDARAQDVSKLIANTTNLGLTPANVRDYLQSGSITGISDARVKANLENSIARFMNSPEGSQMKRKLTKIDGMNEQGANAAISDYLFKVGQAQVHSKQDVNYQVNSPAMQRERWAVEDAQKEAELDIKRKVAQGKLDKDGAPVMDSPARQIFNSANTTIAPDNLKGIMKQNDDGTFDIDASNNLLDFGKIPTSLTPADNIFMNTYEKYRSVLGDKDMSPEKAKEKRYDLEDEVEKLNRSVKSGKVVFRDRSIASSSNPKGWVQGASLSDSDKQLANKQLNDANKKLAEIKVLENEARKNNFKLSDSERYAKLNQDPTQLLGKALSLGGNGKFRMYTNQPNKINVDGQTYLAGEMTFTKKDLSNRFATIKQKTGNTYDDNDEVISGWGNPFKDDWQEVFVEKGIVKPAGTDPKTGEQLYSIPIKYPLQNTPDIRRQINKNSTTEGLYKDNAGAWEKQGADDDYNRELPKRVETKLSSIKNIDARGVAETMLKHAYNTGNTNMVEQILNASEQELLKAKGN